MSLRDLEKILYFEEYVVIDPGTVPGIKKSLLSGSTACASSPEGAAGSTFNPGMGAEAIRILRGMDLDVLSRRLRAQDDGRRRPQKKKKIVKRLKVMEAFLKSGNQPGMDDPRGLAGHPAGARPLVHH